MLGAIAGDVIGSRFEWNNIKTTKFTLFADECFFTDDSVLTIALADSILTGESYVTKMKDYYKRYPHAGYGVSFHHWARSSSSEPYNSWGNGAAMRISPVGFAYPTLKETLEMAERYTALTHNHPEGIRGAQSTAAAIFLGRTGASKGEIRKYVTETFGYGLSRTCDEIRPTYAFDVSSQGTVPQAITAFLESTDFENAIRLAISLGGDSDTLACITGGIAQAFYGRVPREIAEQTLAALDDNLLAVTEEFIARYCP